MANIFIETVAAIASIEVIYLIVAILATAWRDTRKEVAGRKGIYFCDCQSVKLGSFSG